MIEIIRLGENHTTQYRELMLAAYSNSPDAFTSTRAERDWQPDIWWRDRLSRNNKQFSTFGAIDNDRLVGCVGLEVYDQDKTRHKAKLVGMYVKPGYRGKGVGRQMLNSVINSADHRVTSILLSVTEDNAAAVHLYKSLGFATYGVEPAAIYSSGKYLNKAYMRLVREGSKLG